jgi:hypothetical protein
MRRLIQSRTSAAFAAFFVLIWTADPAKCQVDTSSYPRSYPAPSVLDTLGRVQELEIQRQQIELQRLEIERQEQQLRELQFRRQLELERQQAEFSRKRHAVGAKADNSR